MPEQRSYVDIHIIQTLPPSNINRDDAGSPKQAVYGGVRRARVSSQAWKRAARTTLAQGQAREDQATRTKRLTSLVANELAERTGLDAEGSGRIALELIVNSKVTMDKRKPKETSYLLFFGRRQVSRLVDLVADTATELAEQSDDELKKSVEGLDVTGVLGSGHPVDVALFGRMVADLASLNVDAATQVAHAISTHPVEIEFDYFTAVDDENTADETGAGMIGTVEFNSATLYRYATVATHQLAENLGDQATVVSAIGGFIEAFTKSVPSGHQNSFAHRTRPALVLVVVRGDQPVSLATAFESPVLEARSGVETESIKRLADAYLDGVTMWGDEPLYVGASYSGEHPELESVVGQAVPFVDLVADAGRAAISARV